MIFSPTDIYQTIINVLPDAKITVEEFSGGSDHYSVIIISDSFKDLSHLKRHRMIMDLFKDHIGQGLHALTLKTYTFQEI